MPEEEKKEKASETSTPKVSNSDVEQNKGIAAIGYIGILFLIPLLTKKDSEFAQYHAKQGMVLFIFEIVLWVVAMIPVIGWLVSMIGWILGLILFIMGLMNALGGKKVSLPVIGQYAEKINL